MYCRKTLFFFNDTATTKIYTLSLHDALPICTHQSQRPNTAGIPIGEDDINLLLAAFAGDIPGRIVNRSEEHTSELQSHVNLVCRLLLEKKKNTTSYNRTTEYSMSTSNSISI